MLHIDYYLYLFSFENKKYHLGKYYIFTIHEPKERVIKALPYKDRIVHQWYVEEFIKPYIVPKFVNTSFACLKDKGTHRAVEQVQNQLREFKRKYEHFWILKCDIKKFFYNINPHILFNILKKWNILYAQNKLDIPHTMQRINSWIAHSSHCNSYHLQNKILNSCDFLVNSKNSENTINELINLINDDNNKIRD